MSACFSLKRRSSPQSEAPRSEKNRSNFSWTGVEYSRLQHRHHAQNGIEIEAGVPQPERKESDDGVMDNGRWSGLTKGG